MAKPTRPSRPEPQRPDDRAALEQQIESLRKENAELKARLAKGPVDESWFTPGLLSLLFLGLFAALWVRYVPAAARPRAAAVADGGSPAQ